MSKPNAPCKCCTKRTIGCHAKCMRYRVYERMYTKYESKKQKDNEIRDLDFALKNNWVKRQAEDVRYGRTRYVRSTR